MCLIETIFSQLCHEQHVNKSRVTDSTCITETSSSPSALRSGQRQELCDQQHVYKSCIGNSTTIETSFSPTAPHSDWRQVLFYQQPVHHRHHALFEWRPDSPHPPQSHSHTLTPMRESPLETEDGHHLLLFLHFFFAPNSRFTQNCLNAGTNRLSQSRRGTSASASCAGADSPLKRIPKNNNKASPHALFTQTAGIAGLPHQLWTPCSPSQRRHQRHHGATSVLSRIGLRTGLGLILAMTLTQSLNQLLAPNGQHLATLQLLRLKSVINQNPSALSQQHSEGTPRKTTHGTKSTLRPSVEQPQLPQVPWPQKGH